MIIQSNTILVLIILLSAILMAILGPILIPLIRKMGIGQSVRKEGPKTHLAKEGTPTMGGLIIIITLIVLILVTYKIHRFDSKILILLISTLGFGLIGFIDDYLIVVRHNNDGLSGKQKLLLQTLLALFISYYQFKYTDLGGKILIPFTENIIDLNAIYIPFMTFVIVGTVNSVNLTDGLDGLASGITSIVMLSFTLIAIKLKDYNIATFSSIIVGSTLGFLFHNYYPAKIFMGDTGSMALGGAVSGVATLLGLPLVIPIIGAIYLIEALSVIIQVISFQTRGKRIFLMSPLHHHFEHKGWKETKVVKVFWIVTVILAYIGYKSII